MITIEVPGTPAVHRAPRGAYAGLGLFFALLVAVLVWVAEDSGDGSLWIMTGMAMLIISAFAGWLALNHGGGPGHIHLTWSGRRIWSKGCWAALESHTGQLLMLTASILTLLIAAGAIIALPEVHIGVWLIGLVGAMGIAEGIVRLRNPNGWFFDHLMVAAAVPRKGFTAFTWAEVERVEVGRRGVSVTGRGQTVTVPNGSTASDPAVVAGVIEFYRTHPRARAELAGEKFLQRLRSGGL